jgi:hypothetical protein
MNENPSSPLKWYQKGWSVLLFGFILLVVGIIATFVGITFHYWWQIKHGGAYSLSSQFTSPYFTKSVKNATFIDSSKVDRNLIEQGDYQFAGSTQPKITIVEFADFQCPYCGEWQKTIFPKLKEEYIDQGKIRFVYWDYPFLGEESFKAAEAALCSKDQNKFWDYHDYVFKNQNEENNGAFSDSNLKKFAKDLGLDTKVFDNCFDQRIYKAQIEE